MAGKNKAPKVERARGQVEAKAAGNVTILLGAVFVVAVAAGMGVAFSQQGASLPPPPTPAPVVPRQAPAAKLSPDVLKALTGHVCDDGVTLLVADVGELSAVSKLVLSGDTEGIAALLVSRVSGELSAAAVNAVARAAKRVGIANDDFCDCDDGADEAATGACDRGLNRAALPKGAAPMAGCPVQAGAVSIPLEGSRVGDGIPDCCDCADEPAMKQSCPRSCTEEAKNSLQGVRALLAAHEAGMEECTARAQHGSTVFGPAFKHTLKERRKALVEAAKLAQGQIDERQRLAGGPGRPADKQVTDMAAQLMPENELQQLVQWLQHEQPQQEALEHAANAMGRSAQFYPFAPQIQHFGDIQRVGPDGEAAAAITSNHTTLCVNASRHETLFRGGSSVPDSYNFTFVLCPLDLFTMVKEPVVPRGPGPAPSDASEASDAKKDEEPEKPTLLARFIAGNISVDLSAFNSFFALSPGGPGPRARRREDKRTLDAMQAITKRPARTSAKLPPKTPPQEASPLHPFDYELVSSASVRAAAWMSHGESCWGGPHRHARVAFVCGARDALVDVFENGKCAYEAVVETPSACCDGPGSVARVAGARIARLRAREEELIALLQR